MGLEDPVQIETSFKKGFKALGMLKRQVLVFSEVLCYQYLFFYAGKNKHNVFWLQNSCGNPRVNMTTLK